MRVNITLAAGAAVLLGTASPALAQQPAATPTPAPTPTTPPVSDDIVVTGLRDIDDPGSPVTRSTLGSGGATQSRQAFALAERFARCAVKPGMRAADELRGALDGVINGARQAFQQTRFVQLNSTCAQDTRAAQDFGLASVWPGYDMRYYDRGALIIEVIRKFGPDLELTKAQTADPAVQARFNAREVIRARFRLPVDRTYLETAICLVRLQPELSVRLVRTPDYPSVGRVEAAIVNGARICTGNARNVYFDPMQFRFYIADAVYRWAVAARGIDSLIPAG